MWLASADGSPARPLIYRLSTQPHGFYLWLWRSNETLHICVLSSGFSGLGQPAAQKQNRPPLPPATALEASPPPPAPISNTLVPRSPNPRPIRAQPLPSQVALKFSFCQFNSVIDEEEQEKWPGTAGFPVSPSRIPGLAGDG